MSDVASIFAKGLRQQLEQAELEVLATFVASHRAGYPSAEVKAHRRIWDSVCDEEIHQFHARYVPLETTTAIQGDEASEAIAVSWARQDGLYDLIETYWEAQDKTMGPGKNKI